MFNQLAGIFLADGYSHGRCASSGMASRPPARRGRRPREDAVKPRVPHVQHYLSWSVIEQSRAERLLKCRDSTSRYVSSFQPGNDLPV